MQCAPTCQRGITNQTISEKLVRWAVKTFPVTLGYTYTHTQLLHKSRCFWKHRQKTSFGTFWSSAVAFHFLCPPWLGNVPRCCPFSEYEQPKFTRSEIRRVRWLGDYRNYCTTSNVWLSTLSWCRNHSLSLPGACLAASSELYHATSANLTWRNDQ
jgi:hypothetical protein